MALAAFSAVAMLDVGAATADAAPSVSPFAGTYVGADPVGVYPSWVVTITDAGHIAGSIGTTAKHRASISGRVGADGSYSVTVSGTHGTEDDERQGQHYVEIKFSYDAAGTMASDLDGNIVGTTDGGGSFFWLRQ